LHYIDRGNQFKRRKQIYEELYPGTKVGVAQALAMNKILGHNVSAETAPTFVADTSSKTGKSQRGIEKERAKERQGYSSRGNISTAGKRQRKIFHSL